MQARVFHQSDNLNNNVTRRLLMENTGSRDSKSIDPESMSLPMPVFAGGTKAITTTPVVGVPRREYAEMFIPGEEKLEDGEMRVTVLGSGNPWVTRGQASASILVEVGNAERDLLVFDLGSGSLANYASLKLPVNKLNKVFLTHLHADHTGDLITLSGSYAKVGRADGPVKVWGPSGTEPRLGTRHFCEGIKEALAWDTEAGRGPINEDSMRMRRTSSTGVRLGSCTRRTAPASRRSRSSTH